MREGKNEIPRSLPLAVGSDSLSIPCRRAFPTRAQSTEPHSLPLASCGRSARDEPTDVASTMSSTASPVALFAASVLLCVAFSEARRYKDGDVYLSGSNNKLEGNVLIFHSQQWGFICDDYWDQRDAEVVCRQLGHVSALAAYGKSRYRRRKKRK